MRRIILPLAFASVTALVLGSCASNARGTGESHRPSIVTTTTQVSDFTRELAGGEADVTQLIEANQSVHSFDPSAAQLLAIGEADVLVINGAGLESWIDESIEASGFDGELVDASGWLEADGHKHGHEGETTGGEAGHDGDHGDHDDHDHGELDPHIWTDPHLAQHMVETIASGLETALPSSADVIAENAEAYGAELAALDEWIRDNIEAVSAAERLLVTDHDVFGYFVDAYGVTFLGSIMPGLDDNAEPSAAQIDELVADITASGAKAVFSEASISPKAAETIAREAGVTVYSGDEALYGDSLGPEGSHGESYLGAQVHNVRLLLESWGVTPGPLPAALHDALEE